jgi:hypothetical protein
LPISSCYNIPFVFLCKVILPILLHYRFMYAIVTNTTLLCKNLFFFFAFHFSHRCCISKSVLLI